MSADDVAGLRSNFTVISGFYGKKKATGKNITVRPKEGLLEGLL